MRKVKNIQPQPKIHYSYKKKSVVSLACERSCINVFQTNRSHASYKAIQHMMKKRITREGINAESLSKH